MNELTTNTKTVSMMSAQKSYIESIGKGLESLIGKATPYQALCGYNILNSINALLQKEGLDHRSPNVDKASINDAIKFAMLYELNTDNKEVFVIVRNTKVGKKGEEKWIKKIECKPQYKGQLKIVATLGRNVEKVYPEWIVLEGDDFTYPMMKGVEVVPPTWTKKSSEGKVIRVVVPIKYSDGFIDYRIAERESVATNIKAQIKQTLQGKDENEAKRIIALMKDYTLDQLLTSHELAPYINETYKGISSEEMIITKLVINATKRVAIEYGSNLKRELIEKTYDNADVYEKSHRSDLLAQNEARQIEIKEANVEEPAPEPEPAKKENVDKDTGEVFGFESEPDDFDDSIPTAPKEEFESNGITLDDFMK